MCIEFCVIFTKVGISGQSLLFSSQVWPDLWPEMANLCEMFLCVIAENLITC